MSETWTDPHTFTPGEKPRAADLNIIRDNLKFLYSAPQCAVRITSNKTITSQSDTALIWDQVVWDYSAGMWTPGSPTRVRARRAGIYEIVLSQLWSDGAASGGIKRAAFLHVNGSRRRGDQRAPSSPTEMAVTFVTNLNADDYIEIFVRHDADDALDVVANRTTMTVRWEAAAPPFGQGE